MAHPLLLPVACIALLLGPVTHLAYYIRSDLDSSSHKILAVANLVFIGGPLLLYLRGFSAFDTFTLSFTAKLCYIISTFSSIAIYRLCFHPLRDYPGPFWARLSVFWKIREFRNSNYQAFEVVDKAHKQYGDVIRTGPRQLSINNVTAVAQLYSASSECERNHHLEHMRKNLQSLANREEHKARRTVWEHGLSPRVCATYLPRMNDIANQMVFAFHKRRGKPLLINDWCHFYTFDLMGDLGFGRTYGQLQTGLAHPAILKVQRFLRAGVLAVQMLWLVNIGQHMPGTDDPTRDLREWAEQQLAQRARLRNSCKEDVYDRDLMSYVYESQKQVDSRWPMTDKDIAEDAVTLQIAGSDTSYSVLVHLCYYLATYRGLQDKVRTEILTTFEDDDVFSAPTWSKLASKELCPYLDAIINEVLRLHPPVPQGLFRQTPTTHPINVAGYEIPADTIVSCPTYTIQRDARNFSDPDTFIPERWLEASHPDSRSEMIIDRKAFIPFSIGPMSCAGKYLAYMEIKLFVAKVLRQFEVCFSQAGEKDTAEARAQRAEHLKKETKDYFTLWVSDFELYMKPL